MQGRKKVSGGGIRQNAQGILTVSTATKKRKTKRKSWTDGGAKRKKKIERVAEEGNSKRCNCVTACKTGGKKGVPWEETVKRNRIFPIKCRPGRKAH